MGNLSSSEQLLKFTTAEEEEKASEPCESASAVKKKIKRRKPFTFSPELVDLDLSGTCRPVLLFSSHALR
jgi:hypothetical protein